MKGHRDVDEFLASVPHWRAELSVLRDLLLDAGFDESIKWGAPCYSLDGVNLVGFAGFKSYFGLWFHQGALLDDPDEVLVTTKRAPAKALRQWRMHDASELRPARVKRYLSETRRRHRQGERIAPDRSPRRLTLPAELDEALAEDPAARAAFEALTPGRRREYAGYIGEAKREATRRARVDKSMPLIRDGRGLNDHYR